MNYKELVKTSSLPLRLKKELSLKAPVLDFSQKEFIPVFAKSGNEGLLIISPLIGGAPLYFRSNKISSTKSGGKKPIICDLCFCWLPGSKVSMITFFNSTDKNKTHSFYCCSKLNCSANARGLTIESEESRAHLHEDVTTSDKILRLTESIQKVIAIVNK